MAPERHCDIVSSMKKICFTALLGLFAITAYAADITGKWTAEVPGRSGNMQTNTIVLKQEGTKLTGTLDGGRGGPVEIANGKVEGDAVSFTVVRNFNGNEIKQNFKGTISGSEIKFTRTMEGGQGGQPIEFTAKKSTT
jgi:hypothetical protein